jgi:hypothetical protein
MNHRHLLRSMLAERAAKFDAELFVEKMRVYA